MSKAGALGNIEFFDEKNNKEYEHINIQGLIIHIYNDEIYIDKDFIMSKMPINFKYELSAIPLVYKTGPIAYTFSIYQVLGMIQKLAYSDYEKADELLNLCDKVCLDFATLNNFKTFQYLRDAVSYFILSTMRDSCREREADGIHTRFKEQLLSIIPNGEIIDNYKFNRSNVPDFMVKVGGMLRPVEIKKNRATMSAVKQISRYINFYNTDKGYLVAPELSGSLPDNVIFIEFN